MHPCTLLLTVTEVVQLLRLKRQKVYVLLELGMLTGFRVGSDWRVRADSVYQMMARGTQKAA